MALLVALAAQVLELVFHLLDLVVDEILDASAHFGARVGREEQRDRRTDQRTAEERCNDNTCVFHSSNCVFEIRTETCKVRARIAIFAVVNDTAPQTFWRTEPAGCCAFTGHRTYRGEAGDALRRTVEELRAAGVHTFLSGMAVGFDLAAAEAVLACRAVDPTIRLVAVLPFRGQADRFPRAERARYAALLAAADETVVVAESFHRGCFLRRDDWLTGHAATLVTWYDGSPGGTRYTIERALHCGRRLIHLHPQTPRALQPQPELFG